MVSSLIKSTGTFASTVWNGSSPRKAQVLYVPRHLTLHLGDTVETSGYNAEFPEGSLIGTISKIDIKDNEAFYELEIDLSTDFSSLSYVYVIKNNLKMEQDSLQISSFNDLQ